MRDQPGAAGASDALARHSFDAGVDLYWLPLGAGGDFVRLNGRIYEAIQAYRERRRPLDLYHSALEVRVPEARFVIETAWPIPDADPASRGVVLEGPVGSRRIARPRVFRYEVRRWQDGVIPDVLEAVASPRRLSDDEHRARRVLDLVDTEPALVWGRDEGDGRHVELELGGLVAHRSKRPAGRNHPAAGPGARARLEGRTRRGTKPPVGGGDPFAVGGPMPPSVAATA
jgi:hypothetical protein